jgi:hypothetical protein
VGNLEPQPALFIKRPAIPQTPIGPVHHHPKYSAILSERTGVPSDRSSSLGWGSESKDLRFLFIALKGRDSVVPQMAEKKADLQPQKPAALYQGTTSVVPQATQKSRALAPATRSASSRTTVRLTPPPASPTHGK